MQNSSVSPSTPIARFFDTFSHLNSTNNIPALVALYADTFLAAGPQGTQPVTAANFALALPKRKQLFESLGHTSTSLVTLHETQLDPRYTLVRTQWQFTFVRASAPEDILVASTFLVDTAAEPFKILLYLSHQDIFAILKDRVPNPETP